LKNITTTATENMTAAISPMTTLGIGARLSSTIKAIISPVQTNLTMAR